MSADVKGKLVLGLFLITHRESFNTFWRVFESYATCYRFLPVDWAQSSEKVQALLLLLIFR